MPVMSLKSVPGCLVTMAPSVSGSPVAFWPFPSPHLPVPTSPAPAAAVTALGLATAAGAAVGWGAAAGAVVAAAAAGAVVGLAAAAGAVVGAAAAGAVVGAAAGAAGPHALAIRASAAVIGRNGEPLRCMGYSFKRADLDVLAQLHGYRRGDCRFSQLSPLLLATLVRSEPRRQGTLTSKKTLRTPSATGAEAPASGSSAGRPAQPVSGRCWSRNTLRGNGKCASMAHSTSC